MIRTTLLALLALAGCTSAVEPAPQTYCARVRALGCFPESFTATCVEPGESACDVIDPDACIAALEAAPYCEAAEQALFTLRACTEVCR